MINTAKRILMNSVLFEVTTLCALKTNQDFGIKYMQHPTDGFYDVFFKTLLSHVKQIKNLCPLFRLMRGAIAKITKWLKT